MPYPTTRPVQYIALVGMFDDVQRQVAEQEQRRAEILAQQERDANEYAELLRDFVATARRLGIPTKTVVFFQQHVTPLLFSKDVRFSFTEMRRTTGWGPFDGGGDRSHRTTCVTVEGSVETISKRQLKGVLPDQFPVVIPDPREGGKYADTTPAEYPPRRWELEGFLAGHWPTH